MIKNTPKNKSQKVLNASINCYRNQPGCGTEGSLGCTISGMEEEIPHFRRRSNGRQPKDKAAKYRKVAEVTAMLFMQGRDLVQTT